MPDGRDTPNGVSESFAGRRIAFGLSPSLVSDLSQRGAGGWLEDQLARTGPDPDVERRLPAASVVKRSRDQVRGSNFGYNLTHAVVFRARYSRHQLFEMMASMWSDHFNIYLSGRTFYTPEYQEKVIRPNAMGSFADLLRATAESEAMGWYLDNHLSDASKPAGINENYGRELLELHTVGVDNHAEADVVAAAKAMSGWTIDRRSRNFAFNPRMHANEAVTLLGRNFPAAGQQQGLAMLDYLAHHPLTARMVATKICRRFVTDNPPAELVESAARVFLDNDTNIVPVLRHVFGSAQFAASAGQKMRRPLEFVVASLRATDAEVDSSASRSFHGLLGEMGNQPWAWPPPNGFPDVAPYWADTSGLSLRWSFAARLCHNNIDGARTNVTRLRGQAGSAAAYVGALAGQFGLGALPDRDVDAILSAYGFDRSSAASALDDAEAADIAALVLVHPTFQLR